MNLKQLRLHSKLKQIEVAEYLNITKQGYSHYETGVRTPDLDTLCRLSDLYKVSLDYLVGRKEPDIKIIQSYESERIYAAYLNASDSIREAVDKLLDL